MVHLIEDQKRCREKTEREIESKKINMSGLHREGLLWEEELNPQTGKCSAGSRICHIWNKSYCKNLGARFALICKV